MMETPQRVLPGFRFRPSEEVLLRYYLTKKINEEEIPALAPITEIDFYKEEPWKIVQQLGYSEKDSLDIDLYSFNRVHSKFTTGKVKKRTVESGCWKIEKTTDVTVQHGNHQVVIGLKRTLSFHLKNKSKVKDKGWIMYEYVLPGSPNAAQGYEWAISRVKRGRVTEDKSSSSSSSCPQSPIPSKRPAECLDSDDQSYVQMQNSKRPKISNHPISCGQASASTFNPMKQEPKSGNHIQSDQGVPAPQHEDQSAHEEEDKIRIFLANCEDPEYCRNFLESSDSAPLQPAQLNHWSDHDGAFDSDGVQPAQLNHQSVYDDNFDFSELFRDV